MALDPTLLSDLQGDIGITDDQSIFTDEQLERLYTRAAYDQDKTVYLAFRQLLAQSRLFYDFTIGMSSEKRSQIRNNIKEMVALWDFANNNEVDSIGMHQVPDKKKDKPWRQGHINKQLERRYWEDEY